MEESLMKRGVGLADTPHATLPAACLVAAARNGHGDALRALVALGADVNARDAGDGATACHSAAAHGHPAAIRALGPHSSGRTS